MIIQLLQYISTIYIPWYEDPIVPRDCGMRPRPAAPRAAHQPYRLQQLCTTKLVQRLSGTHTHDPRADERSTKKELCHRTDVQLYAAINHRHLGHRPWHRQGPESTRTRKAKGHAPPAVSASAPDEKDSVVPFSTAHGACDACACVSSCPHALP